MDLNRLDRLGRNTNSENEKGGFSQLKPKNDLGRLDRNRYRRVADQVRAEKQEIRSYDKNDLNDKSTTSEETFTDLRDFADVLGFPAALLDSVPYPPRLILGIHGFDTPVVFDFHPHSNTWRRQPESKHPTFDIDEISVLIEAVENERVHARDFVRFVQKKIAYPGWRLSREEALEGTAGLIVHPAEPRGWSLGKVLRALGCRLKLIRIRSLDVETGRAKGPYMEAKGE